jgi:hypothetical protein
MSEFQWLKSEVGLYCYFQNKIAHLGFQALMSFRGRIEHFEVQKMFPPINILCLATDVIRIILYIGLLTVVDRKFQIKYKLKILILFVHDVGGKEGIFLFFIVLSSI